MESLKQGEYEYESVANSWNLLPSRLGDRLYRKNKGQVAVALGCCGICDIRDRISHGRGNFGLFIIRLISSKRSERRPATLNSQFVRQIRLLDESSFRVLYSDPPLYIIKGCETKLPEGNPNSA